MSSTTAEPAAKNFELIREISSSAGFAEAGALITYTGKRTEAYHEAAVYVGTILRGANPADLPIQQPTKFELMVNMKTARAPGARMPNSILVRADKVSCRSSVDNSGEEFGFILLSRFWIPR